MTRITVARDVCHRQGRPELIAVILQKENARGCIGLKIILSGTMLVTTLGMVRVEGEPAQKRPTRQPSV
jgi:hypothetical protein